MKSSARQAALREIAKLAPLHTMTELAAMEWPTADGSRARFSMRTILDWLRDAGVTAKPHPRHDNELSDEAKVEILRRFREGETTLQLSKVPWKMRDGKMRLVHRTTIYDAAIRRKKALPTAFAARPATARAMSDAAWNRWMLFGDQCE